MNVELQKEFINEIKNLTYEFKKHNELLHKNKKPNINKNFIYYIKRYIEEFFEASIGLLIAITILKKSFEFDEFLRIVSLIALITLILEEYNSEYLQNFRQGIHFTLGSMAFNT